MDGGRPMRFDFDDVVDVDIVVWLDGYDRWDWLRRQWVDDETEGQASRW